LVEAAQSINRRVRVTLFVPQAEWWDLYTEFLGQLEDQSGGKVSFQRADLALYPELATHTPIHRNKMFLMDVEGSH